MIAMPDEKWGERPLLVVTPKEGKVRHFSCGPALPGAAHQQRTRRQAAARGDHQGPRLGKGRHASSVWCPPAASAWRRSCPIPASARPSQAPTREGVLRFLEGKVARWWMPDDVVFVKGASALASPARRARCLSGVVCCCLAAKPSTPWG